MNQIVGVLGAVLQKAPLFPLFPNSSLEGGLSLSQFTAAEAVEAEAVEVEDVEVEDGEVEDGEVVAGEADAAVEDVVAVPRTLKNYLPS